MWMIWCCRISREKYDLVLKQWAGDRVGYWGQSVQPQPQLGGYLGLNTTDTPASYQRH